MEVNVSGADKAQVDGWVLLVDGNEVLSGKGRFPAKLFYTFKEFPAKDPSVELVVAIAPSTIQATSTLTVPEVLKQRLIGKPVARLAVATEPTDATGAAFVSFDASQSFVTRGGWVSAWELSFGDGAKETGSGQPPAKLIHKYVNTSSDRVIFLASLTVFSAPVGNGVLASFPATLMAGVDPPARLVNGAVLRFGSTNGLGTAIFTTVDLLVGPAKVNNTKLAALRWYLTADGKRIEGGDGAVPEQISHLFGSVTQKQKVTMELVVEMSDGSKQSASLTVELIPTDGPAAPPLVQPEPVKTVSRRENADGEPVV
jgi:hypothetical protein